MVPSSSVAGLLNLNCVHDIHAKSNAVHPHDPTYDFFQGKAMQQKHHQLFYISHQLAHTTCLDLYLIQVVSSQKDCGCIISV